MLPLVAVLLLAQAPEGPDGLVASPNPKIRHAFNRQVFWKTSTNRGLSGPAGQAITATLNQLIALLKATPTGSTGTGFWVSENRSIFAPGPRLPYSFETGMFPFYHEDVLQPNGTWRLSVAGETESIYYQFNTHPESLDQPRVVGDFYLRPRITGQLANLPIYENESLLITRPGRDLWAPVTVGEALTAAMPQYTKDRQYAESRLAELKKKSEDMQLPDYEQQMWARFEQQNGSLKTTRPGNYEARRNSLAREITYNRQVAREAATPQRDPKGAWYWDAIDRHDDATRLLATAANQPACYLNNRILPKSGDPNCRDLVRTNFAYFDPALPRTSVQLFMVKRITRCLNAKPFKSDRPMQGCVQHAQMWRELDWSAIARLVAP